MKLPGWSAVLICLGALGCGCGTLPPVAAFASRLPAYHDGDRFVIVGDLQRTSWLEFWREQNDRERELLVAAIAAEGPAWLAITGDLVFDGSSGTKWARFDELTTPWRAAGVPVFGALGNHEYWGGRLGELGFFDRLPIALGRHWYTVAYGPLGVVVLDSNIDVLDASEWAEQLRFYEQALAGFDADPGVRGVLVMFHHPPFTNSTVTSDEDHVQRDLLPPFLRAHKTLVMQCGHVHSYERFARAGKMFVVSGGGGGPRAALDVGEERRHADDLFAGPALRDFNFVTYTLDAGGLSAEVKGMAKGGTVFQTMDRFVLPWPAAGSPSVPAATATTP